jgi:hypothetical protein
MIDVAVESDRAVHHARRAVELGSEDAVALAVSGFTLAYVGEQLDFGADCIARGLSLNGNFALGWHLSGWVNLYLAIIVSLSNTLRGRSALAHAIR